MDGGEGFKWFSLNDRKLELFEPECDCIPIWCLLNLLQQKMIYYQLYYFRYRELEETNLLVKWLWNILENFTEAERVLFMRFVSGRSRLPANLADLSQRFQVSLRSKSSW